MSVDLTQFHAAFYAESFEAVDSMEQTLLQLDVAQPDPESINTIFRVAHSIKGGAATFGFSQISSFTHSLESLLDQLRSQRMQVTGSLTDLLLRAVDVIRAMLRARQAGGDLDAQRVADLQFEVELAVAQAGPTQAVASAERVGQAAPARRYRIEFRPLSQLLARGNDPLRLFRELRALGDLEVRAHTDALPSLQEFDPEQCYLAWTLQLQTAAAPETIREVFEWAEGDCALEITPLDAEPEPVPCQQTVAPTAVVAAPAAASGEVGSIRVSVEKIDDLMNSVGELVITQSMLGQLVDGLDGAAGEQLRAGLAQLERNVRELQESVMRVRMIPISFVFSRFPRMVRDLSQRLGKQVELKLSGSETELDKTVLEKIGDPLVHLVRNCIDHGIESPERRRAAGKSERGTLHLHAYHHASSITVEVSDDGAGLQRERILAKARERGLVGAHEQPDEQGVYDLIFLPGFSTVEQATDVSGRGVGMDVVKRNVESLGGSIQVHSVPGQGARFVITLPVTLAIIDGQTVAVGDESYIVPLTAIVESLQSSSATIKRVVGHGEVLSFRGEYLPVVRLEQQFRSRRSRAREGGDGLVMVVEGEGRRVGLLVDELLGQQQVVVKTLEANYGHVEGIAGATILGNGSVALILDVGALARCAAEPLAA
jgi:two-component system chemotaxis sensor kinase CheA